MTEPTEVRAAIVQLMDTLRELEASRSLDVQLRLLRAIEGYAGQLAGVARDLRREISPPAPSSHKGCILRALVAQPGLYTSGTVARRLGLTSRQARDAVAALRVDGWVVQCTPGRRDRLKPTMRAMQALGDHQQERKGARQMGLGERPWVSK